MVRYFTPGEVAEHNVADDCWVSLHGKVLDLTPLINEHAKSALVAPIIAAAGTDISHWFDAATGDVRTYVDPVTELTTYYTPMGRFVHVAPPRTPSSDWDTSFGTPWWKNDEAYLKGKLSVKTRKLRVVNTLTAQEHVIEVCSEESLRDILTRYLALNSHAASYTWRRLGKDLEMDKTLADNGIDDDTDAFLEADLDEHFYIPAVHLYFNDDLTVA